jgi:hypothetical protein
LNKKVLFIILLSIAQDLKAQNQFLQLTLGAGAGFVKTYASNPAVPIASAFNGNVCYYPLSFFNIELEGQIGKLAGETAGKSPINFTNRYQAAFVVSNLRMGVFFKKSSDPALDFLKSFYLGAGFGMIHNRITNTIDNHYYYHNIIPVIPVKIGYEFDLISVYGDPILKMDFSSSLNSTVGRGIYGDYGSSPRGINPYVYFSVQLKYAINLERY